VVKKAPLDGKQLLPSCEPEIIDRRDDLNAGITYQDVDAAVGFNYFRHASLDLILLRHVHCDGHCPRASVVDRGSSSLGTISIEIGDGNARALTNVSRRDLPADAACCTSNDRDFAFQAHAYSPVTSALRT
jgi:hypothetical protein